MHGVSAREGGHVIPELSQPARRYSIARTGEASPDRSDAPSMAGYNQKLQVALFTGRRSTRAGGLRWTENAEIQALGLIYSNSRETLHASLCTIRLRDYCALAPVQPAYEHVGKETLR